MNLETKQIEEHLKAVQDEYLRRMTAGQGDLLRQVEDYTASRTGKMLRPRMLLAAAATLGDDRLASRRTLLLATAVEMLHNASLLHDDVVDNDLTRRGQPSVNARWSNNVAVLVGDYHLVSIMQLLSEIGDSDVTHRFIDTVKSMVEAELLQLSPTDCQLSTYLKIIDGKTANLFALAAELGNPACRDYGLHYGRLFQLRDDLADGDATPFTRQLVDEEEAILQEITF